MMGSALQKILPFLVIIEWLNYVSSEFSREKRSSKYIDCQQRSTSGRDYVGKANTTDLGIPCQRWSDTHPHYHPFTQVGDHNFCRNPSEASSSQVWCFTSDPKLLYGYCSVPFCPPLKALDFSLDNDQRPDENKSYTHASLKKENFPSSFTICTAFMVEAWHAYTNALLFVLHNDDGKVWHWVQIVAQTTYTEFSFLFEDLPISSNQSKALFYPLQWTRVCLSKDSNTSLTRLVVDGELVVEKEVKVNNQPDNLNLVLGLWVNQEYTGQTTDLNIFSFAQPADQMKSQTRGGEKECGLAGNFLSWEKSLEEEQWTLHSKARWIDLDSGLEGPCKAEAKMNVFPMNEKHYHSDCMRHCEKLGGQSPSVNTKKEWENLFREIRAVSPDPSKLPKSWLSATEGYRGNELGNLDHWPEGVEAEEGMWRDFYTGEQLENYTKPWVSSNGDKGVEDTYNCISFYPTMTETRTWEEWQCVAASRGCPCTYDPPPVIRLKGFCTGTAFEYKRYTVTQFAADPSNILMVGGQSAQIKYNYKLSQWVYSDPRLNLTAWSRASQNSFALGKHNWTVAGDKYPCSEGKEYTLEMKLTGCDYTQFTCDDGQCIKMEERCNQMPNCKDKSDEMDCRILVLERGYNQRVPPVGTTTSGDVTTLKPVEVKVSLTLFKVVAIEEEDHSIQLQFQITLEWKENRATYHNLKSESYLNALSTEEINTLWLPLVIYLNTDQQETTRLGCCVEWSTEVNVKREGNPSLSGYEVLDETYLFKGDENSLIMTQSYTHDFQCVYQLQRYPFDTQVGGKYLTQTKHYQKHKVFCLIQS